MLGSFEKHFVAGRRVSSSSDVTARLMGPQTHYAVLCGAVRRRGNAGRNFQLGGFNFLHYKSERNPTHCSSTFGRMFHENLLRGSVNWKYNILCILSNN